MGCALMRALVARWHDFKREVRIARLGRQIKVHVKAGNLHAAGDAFNRLRDEVLSRSPEQRDRMERAQGLR